jgi:hypothetical protein
VGVMTILEHELTPEQNAICPEAALEPLCPACNSKRRISAAFWKVVWLVLFVGVGLAIEAPLWLILLVAVLLYTPIVREILGWCGKAWRGQL